MAETVINRQAHINYEALDEFRLAFEEARKSVTDALETKLNTVVGDDTGKSARAIAAEELAKQLIPENAKESLDTLEEIAAWIQSHPNDASAMNAAIEKLNAIVAGIGGDSDDYATIVEYVAAKVQELSIGNYYTKTEVDTELAKKVDKEDGKSLVSDTEIAKLANVSEEANKTTATAEATDGFKVGTVTNDGTATDFYIPIASKADIRAMFAPKTEA